MKILVAGGAGYIGSQTVRELLKQKHQVVVYDNLSCGHAAAVDKRAKLVVGDVGNFKKTCTVLKQEKIEAVINFCGYTQVGESVINPGKYIKNNITAQTTLLEAMVVNKVKYIIYSSSAAVYGEPKKIPIKEIDPKQPVNTYGLTKWTFEQILESYSKAYQINYCALRYFNAAGADPDSTIGEDHSPETHIIPLVIQTALGQRDKFIIFGKNYKTKDGTCVRDYIHVSDLATAHTKALKYIISKQENAIFNLGIGKGFSNLEVVETVKKISDIDFKVEFGARRPGDPAKLIANANLAQKALNWQPKYVTIEDIVKTAYSWHKENPKGYKK